MPLSNIVTVVLRLFAIQIVGQSINMALSFAAGAVKDRYHPPHYWLAFLAPVAGLVFALLEWCLAPVIARWVTRNHDAEVSVGTLSRLDLYSFAFVFLGLYFILTSVAPALNWLHYYLGVSTVGSQSESQSSFYTLASYLVTLTAGLLALLPARRWARKLLAREGRDEAVRPNDAASTL
jgi:hypothetical protein